MGVVASKPSQYVIEAAPTQPLTPMSEEAERELDRALERKRMEAIMNAPPLTRNGREVTMSIEPPRRTLHTVVDLPPMDIEEPKRYTQKTEEEELLILRNGRERTLRDINE